MEFTSAGPQHSPISSAPSGSPVKHRRPKRRWLNAVILTLLIAIALLVGSVILITSFVGGKQEADLVDSNKYQAVFLDGGQVYFGKIKSLNDDYLTIDNVYYLRVNGQQQAATQTESQSQQDISLARLGCELHGPQDLMVINRSRISFWENLKDEGKVVVAINDFIKKNPNGQKCQEGTSQDPANSSNNAADQQNPEAPAPTDPATP